MSPRSGAFEKLVAALQVGGREVAPRQPSGSSRLQKLVRAAQASSRSPFRPALFLLHLSIHAIQKEFAIPKLGINTAVDSAPETPASQLWESLDWFGSLLNWLGLG